MKVFNSDLVHSAVESTGLPLKLVANESSVYFFPTSTEHREAKQPGLSYEDDSAGNALAGIIKEGLIEFRFHRAFSEQRVTDIARSILSHSQLEISEQTKITYQGRQLPL